MPSRQAFSYSVPAGMHPAVGQMVTVPFGSRTLQGIVMELTERPNYPETRNVIGLVGDGPLISPERIVLAAWLAERYLAPLFDCVALMLPAGSRRRPLTFYALKDANIEANTLDETQAHLAAYVKQKSHVEQREIAAAFGRRSLAVAEQLVRRGLLSKTYGLDRPRAQPKEVQIARLLVGAEEALVKAEEMMTDGQRVGSRMLRTLAEKGGALALSALRAEMRVSAEDLHALENSGLVAIETSVVRRDPLQGRDYPRVQPPNLTKAQSSAYGKIAEAIETRRSATFLLHGVTGSGKTEVYLRALEKAIALGKRAIVLVPEISLTPQTVRRFAERFPGGVAVMHSGLSLGEQFDQWHGIAEGRYDVVIGARSTVFAPQPDLGLIVVDEEHEWTYKQQDPAPRYHTRLAAEKLAQLTGAALVLGSATPSLESYQAALAGRYALLQLPERVIAGRGSDTHRTTTSLPGVRVVNMADELKDGHYDAFSRPLIEGLKRTLAAGQQAILFVNRRGSASFVQCTRCGFVPRCTSCSVSLTLHAEDESLVCHSCNRKRKALTNCPQCGETNLRQQGLGTQGVEQEMRRLFPQARTLRWDRDATRTKDAHERILQSFVAHEADVLIGTQMVAKGLDIRRITMVGVVAADMNLYLPDFNSAERTFQLLSQVAGRAGRGSTRGEVVVQTFTPVHYAIQAAAKHDYQTFYRMETALRRACGYPPFGRLARLLYAHTNPNHAEKEAGRIAKLLRQSLTEQRLSRLHVLGPTPAYVPKVRGRYRWQIIIKGGQPNELLAPVTLPEGWVVDIDPVSLL